MDPKDSALKSALSWIVYGCALGLLATSVLAFGHDPIGATGVAVSAAVLFAVAYREQRKTDRSGGDDPS
jgi:hypothetical protein